MASTRRERERRRWARATRLISGVALLALGFGLLSVPEVHPLAGRAAAFSEFRWGKAELWADLEEQFDAARGRGCDATTAQIDEHLTGLDALLLQLERNAQLPSAPVFDRLEQELFATAALFGACPTRIEELATRVVRLRSTVKEQSRSWPLDERVARDRLYRLLYGSRAALEEIWLQAPAESVSAVLHGVDEPSATPSLTLQGVKLHSGDLLLSRGGAPTSALIARGNDYPGNFSHVALLHIDEKGRASVIESHIESGVGISSVDRYLGDTKLRIVVLRLRADHPALVPRPRLPHDAATRSLLAAKIAHIPYDFAMDSKDPQRQFCSEVPLAAYREEGVALWKARSRMSRPGLVRWLSSLGVRHFETEAPSDLEYDPQLRVVAEWRDPRTLFADHRDNAILDAMLESADQGTDLEVSTLALPAARLLKAASVGFELLGEVGPIPEGMSPAAALRVRTLRARHAKIAERLERRIATHRKRLGRLPPYWTLVEEARQAMREGPLE